jgi:hypothetical protein
MAAFNGGQILAKCSLQENTRIIKRILHYHWNHDKFMFQDLCVPRLDERKQFILDDNEEIGHFGKGCTLAKVYKWYF